MPTPFSSCPTWIRSVRRALFAKPATEQAQPPTAPAPETAPGEPPAESTDRPHRVNQRAGGDRVRIFGDVTVLEGEEVTGQVVAVIGSVRVDGEVGDQVVSVLGSVDLGPKAVVRGDIVSVGGRVRRAPGSQVGGAVTEVSLADARWDPRFQPWLREVGLISMFDGFRAVCRAWSGRCSGCCCSCCSRRWPWWLRARPSNDPPSVSATTRSGRR